MLRMHVPKLEPDLSDLEKYDLLSYMNFMRRSATYSNSPVILVKLPREFGMLFTGKAEEYLNNKKLKNDEFCRVKLNLQESMLDQRIITLFKMETKKERKPSPTFPKDHFKNNENNPNLIFDKTLESYVLRKSVDPRKYFQSEYHKEHNVFNYAQDLEDSLMEQTLKKHPIFHSWNLNKLDNPLKIVMPNSPGITISNVYIGQDGDRSSGHFEDLALASASYLFPGSAPKIWLCVDKKYYSKLVHICKNIQDEIEQKQNQGKKSNRDQKQKTIITRQNCANPLAHKDIILPVETLEANDIPYYLVEQPANHLVVVFEAVYHQICDTGNNLSEAVNFASPRWQVIGRIIKNCSCPVPRQNYHDGGWFPAKTLLLDGEDNLKSIFGTNAANSFNSLLDKYATRDDKELPVYEKQIPESSSKTAEPVGIVNQHNDAEDEDMPEINPSTAFNEQQVGNSTLEDPPIPLNFSNNVVVESIAQETIRLNVDHVEPSVAIKPTIAGTPGTVQDRKPKREAAKVIQLTSEQEAIKKVRKSIQKKKAQAKWRKSSENKTGKKAESLAGADSGSVKKNKKPTDPVLIEKKKLLNALYRKIQRIRERQKDTATALNWFDFNERMNVLQCEKNDIERQRDLYKLMKMFVANDKDLLELAYSQGYSEYELIRDYCSKNGDMLQIMLEGLAAIKSKHLVFWRTVFDNPTSCEHYFNVQPEFRKPWKEKY